MSNEIWDSLWVGGKLITMSGMHIDNGAIAIKDGYIAWIGALPDLPTSEANSAKRVYDLEKKWVTPGLIDCHTHLVYSGSRSTEFIHKLKGKTYSEINKSGGGVLATVKTTRQASYTQLYEETLPRLQKLMSEGITTIEIKSGYGLDLETELKILRVAKQLGKDFPINIKTTYLGTHALPTEYTGEPDKYINYICDEVLPTLYSEKLIDYVDTSCESTTFTPEQCKKIFTKAQKLKLPIKIHTEQFSDLPKVSPIFR